MSFLSMYGLDDEDSDETGAEPGTTDATSATDTNQIVSLFNKYYGGDTYGAKLEEARKKRETQLSDYQKALEQSAAVEGAEPSKAELYYRLSSALLEPGETGDFWESLGRAGKTVGEFEKEKRLARREKELGGLKIKTEMQKLGIESTGDEISTLQALAAREMQDRTKLFGEIAKSMKPATAVSPAGKIAEDEGKIKGTPEFAARVREIETQRRADEEARAGREQGRLDAMLAGLASKREALSQQEIKQLWELEDQNSAADTSLGMLKQALQYSQISFALDPKKNASDWAQYQLTQQRDPNNKRVIATNYLLNLLSRQSLENLKATFGGAGITNEERAALDRLQGMSGASHEERALIINNTINLLMKRLQKNKSRMDKIYEGGYTRRPPAGAQ